jgi:hypothetical protein
VNVSVTPAAGGGLTQEFAAVYSDSNGLADINDVMLSVHSSSSLTNGCVARYVRGTNQLFLMNDAGTAWLGPGTPGSAGTVQNSQCTLDPQSSSTISAGNNLTVNYALSFAQPFQGQKSIFMNLSNNVSLSTGFEIKGTWIVGLKKARGQLTSQ